MNRQALVFKAAVLALTVLGVTARATHPVDGSLEFVKNRYITLEDLVGTFSIHVTLTESLQFSAAAVSRKLIPSSCARATVATEPSKFSLSRLMHPRAIADTLRSVSPKVR